MSNICFNKLTIKTADFNKISNLLSKDEGLKFAQPYIDFNKIIPISEGQSRSQLWGTTSLPIDTHIHVGSTLESSTLMYFDTANTAPIKAIEAIVRLYKIEASIVGYEPSMETAEIYNFSFKDGFDPDCSNTDEYLIIHRSQDIDEACNEIFGYDHQEYLRTLNGENDGDCIIL